MENKIDLLIENIHDQRRALLLLDSRISESLQQIDEELRTIRKDLCEIQTWLTEEEDIDQEEDSEDDTAEALPCHTQWQRKKESKEEK